MKKKTRTLLLLSLISAVILVGVYYKYGRSKPAPIIPPAPSTIVAATSTTPATSSIVVAPSLPPSAPIAIATTPPVIATPPPSVPSTPTPVPETLDYRFGISTGDTLPYLSPTNLAAELDDIASLHIGWIRLDMSWADIQPTPNGYNWGSMDRVITAANQRQIQVLPIIDYTPAWARLPECSSSPSCIATDPSLYGIFAKAVVSRYAPQGVSAWEIWNEPNLAGAWKPQPNVLNYTILLKTEYAAIKSIEPSSTVITGGLGPTAGVNGSIAPVDFVSQLYANGARGYFDAIGLHPYTYPALPLSFHTWNAWSQIATTNQNIRGVMTANGEGNKKIWITEYGAPTGGPGNLESSPTDMIFAGAPDHVSEALQAQMISEAITTVKNSSWAGPLFIYSYKDIGTSPSTIENFFGIIRNDGSTKPAYQLIKMMLSK